MYMSIEAIVTGNQNGVKQSTLFLEVDQGLGIKMNSERLISTNQDIFSDTREVWQCFCSLTPKIKRSRASEGNDPAIKDVFHRSRFLIPVAKCFYG